MRSPQPAPPHDRAATQMTSLDAQACKRLFEIGARGGGSFAGAGDFFEQIIRDIYSAVLKRGDLCVDGGANVGKHTFPMAEAVGRDGMVLAAEAIRKLARNLAAEAARRNSPQIKVVDRALYDRLATVDYHFVENNPGYSGIEARRYDFEAKIKRIRLQTTTIDALLREHNLRFRLIGRRTWRFCKLDLEGGELRALQGAQTSMRLYGPLIVFENGQDLSARYYGYSREEWFSFFASLRYAVFTLWGHDFTPADWGRQDIPWYFIAAPQGSAHAQFVSAQLPDLLRKYLG